MKIGQAAYSELGQVDGVNHLIAILAFLIGFGMAVSGSVTLIAYLNFLPAGITWHEYFVFVSTRLECYLLPIGFIMMAIALSRLPNKM